MANEKRLIDANALSIQVMDASYWDNQDEDVIWDLVQDAPTVDAVEVVHGRWCWEGRFKACSVCGTHIDTEDTLGASFWKFCPFCGTKMDGGAENA